MQNKDNCRLTAAQLRAIAAIESHGMEVIVRSGAASVLFDVWFRGFRVIKSSASLAMIVKTIEAVCTNTKEGPAK
jgi:hypothetical protein